MAKVLCFGSINADFVYRVPHFVRPGETLKSLDMKRFAGGKGANQSVALARAGAKVAHAGRVGRDGEWLVRKLADEGIDTSAVVIDDGAVTGSAIIQVTDAGENAIILDAGANGRISKEQVHSTLQRFQSGDWLLLQNEVNEIPDLIRVGCERGMHIAFNAAPCTAAVLDYPLDQVDMLIVNETEAAQLTGCDAPDSAIHQLPGRQRIITLGPDGAMYASKDMNIKVPSPKVAAVDTTAAGDTWIGYFVASLLGGMPVQASLVRACEAASICVGKPGAMESIPRQACS